MEEKVETMEKRLRSGKGRRWNGRKLENKYISQSFSVKNVWEGGGEKKKVETGEKKKKKKDEGRERLQEKKVNEKLSERV